MAMFESNKQYQCECGSFLFKEEEVFLIEEEKDNTRLSSQQVYKKTGNAKRIVCIECGKEFPYWNDIK